MGGWKIELVITLASSTIIFAFLMFLLKHGAYDIKINFSNKENKNKIKK